MLELKIALVVRGKLNFNLSFLEFNVKKKIYVNSYFERTLSI